MRMSRFWWLVLILLVSANMFAQTQVGQGSGNPLLIDNLRTLVGIPAVPGYESELTDVISGQLKGWSLRHDNVGDVIVTIGDGSPHRLLMTTIDEPGFVVSGITDEGYLRLQRLPQQGLSAIWNELYSAQPVTVRARDGRWINGAVAGLSVHLQPGRKNPPDMGDIENLFVDIGAANREEVRAAGVDVLAPLALDRMLYEVGATKLNASCVQNRFGAAALLQMLHNLDRAKVKGTLTVAFATQQWSGSRGLIRLLEENNPDELVFVGPMLKSTKKTGTGVLVATTSADTPANDMTAEFKQAGNQLQVTVETESPATLIGRSYSAPPKMPARSVQVGIPVAWPNVPAQYVDGRDLAGLVRLLERYAQGDAKASPEIVSAAAMPEPGLGSRPQAAPSSVEVLRRLIEAYGASDHEAAVGDEVVQLLPSWAKPTKDKSGNWILRWGGEAKAGGILVVAHQDEIGFEVKSVMPDGRLALESKGGGVPAFFAGHAILFHTASGMRPAVLELPAGWNEANFHWPSEQKFEFVADVGANSADEVAKLNIKVGDYATVPKKYRPMFGTRATARAFDDRMGCAALVSAVWKLGPNLDRPVTFVWSTGEELGLLGAGAVAQQLAAEGKSPTYVFAIDTFVSADSPIESKRFGDAKVGKGFVIRAVDNSNIVPHDLVNYLLKLVGEEHIAAQYGVTGGGNDGSAFVRYGPIDVAMGWPLRYSHSPAEVIDIKDLDALTDAVVTVSRKWSPAK